MRKEEKQKKEKKECGTLTNVIKREMIITAFAKRLVSWLNSYECYKSEEKVLQKGDKYYYTGSFRKFPFDLSAASKFPFTPYIFFAFLPLSGHSQSLRG